MSSFAEIAKTYIQTQKPDFNPQLGLILGSGLREIADELTDATVIPYAKIPHFVQTSVSGHASALTLGYLKGVPTVCMQGRIHYYEGFKHGETIKTYIRTLKLLGIHTLLLTNAAGSLHQDVLPGDLFLINDHINFQGHNPLIGPNDEEFGPRFFGMEEAYDLDLREQLLAAAQKSQLPLAQGVYAAVLGPNFETPAEIRALRLLGADAVGMSTVPEVIVAKHCGLKVAAISAITNLAAGMNHEALTHEGTLLHGQKAAKTMTQLIFNFMEGFSK